MSTRGQSSAQLPMFMENALEGEIAAMNDTARGIIMVLRNVGNKRGEDLRVHIVEELSPEMMFNRGTAPFPSLWTYLKKFLNDRGVQIRVHHRHRTIYTVANTIYVEPEDNATANDLAKNILSGAIYSSYTASYNESSSEIVEEKTAHNVAMRLKNVEDKFSGDLGQCWQDFKDEYDQIADDYRLSDDQKMRYLHNLFTKDAHRFFLDKVKPLTDSYEEAVALMEREYNLVVRQTRVKNHLSSLRLDHYKSSSVDTAGALAIVYKRILNLSRQVPVPHRGDAHKIEFLRGAVIGHPWAKEPLSRVATAGISFQQLYAELEIAVQLERESAAASARPATSSAVTTVVSEKQHDIYFAGQGKFVRRNYKGRSQPSRRRACFNCGSESHLVKKCPHPVNFSRAAASQIRSLQSQNTRNAVHVVLAHLCRELDESFNTDDNEIQEANDDDVAVFEEMLVSDDQDMNVECDAGGDDELENMEIFAVQVGFDKTCSDFQGACIDSGAQKKVIGSEQAEAYLHQVGDRNSLKPGRAHERKRFRFGNNEQKCEGILSIRMPVADDIVVKFDAFIVPIDFPLLLGLDVLRKLRLIIDFDDGSLASKYEDWRVKLIFKLGHLYVEWPPSVYYTEHELRKIHRHFFHPHTDKLVNLIHRGAEKHATPQLREQLEKVRQSCDTCQRLSKEPSRFRVAMPNEKCTFNRVVGMDIMKIGNKSILHIVDQDTKFGAATFLQGESSEKVWESFLCCWVATYVGFPDEVILDQGTQFQSSEFRSLLSAANIKRRDAGIESHNSLGETERYHVYLRNIFERVRSDHPKLSDAVALQLSVKACNDTAGPEGLVPTLLVFGVVPRMPVHKQELPNQRERMIALHNARGLMAKAIAKMRLGTALNRRVPSSVDSDLKIGDLALVYRDKENRWMGPWRVIDINEKSIHIDCDGRLIEMSMDKCKPYHVADEVRDLMHANRDNDETLTQERAETTQEETQTGDGFWDFSGSLPDMSSIFMVRTLSQDDPRANMEDFKQAMAMEIEGLRNRKVWEIVHEKDVLQDANIVGGRFVLSLKSFSTPEETAKARYIAQGYADKQKEVIAHDAVALRPVSIRIILSVASIMGWRVFSHDVTQVYLQSKDELAREVYIRPKKQDRAQLNVKDGELLKLVKPLYGLCDSGDYWNATINHHLIHDLKMEKAISDSSLHFRFDDGKLMGIVGNYVDDDLNAGNKKFQDLTMLTLTTFKSKPRVCDNLSFFGTQIFTRAPGTSLFNQEHFVRSLTKLPLDCDISSFRRARSLLAWTQHCRTEFACLVNKALQITEETICKSAIIDLNKGICEAKSFPDRGLVFAPLDLSNLQFRVYADASFATNSDLSSQLGYLILLCDVSNRFHVLDYCSRKSRRVVRFVMGGELYASTDAFDAAVIISEDLTTVFGKKIPLRMFTDSKQVFDLITRVKRPTERRLAIDVTAAREAYQRFEVDRVGLIRREFNPADELSKVKSNQRLSHLLRVGLDETPVEQWIVRSDLKNKNNKDETSTSPAHADSNNENLGECETNRLLPKGTNVKGVESYTS